MKKTAWDNSFSVGNETLDFQHKRFLSIFSLFILLTPLSATAQEWYAMARHGECVPVETISSRKTIIEGAKTPTEIEEKLKHSSVNYTLKPMSAGIEGMLELKVLDDNWGLILVRKKYCQEFNTLGEIFSYEVKDEWKLRQKSKETQRKNKVVNDRFTGALDFTFKKKLYGSMQIVEIQGEYSLLAYLESNSNMLFSDWVQINTSEGLLPLEDAKKKCREIQPKGYWDLVTEAENLFVIKNVENKPFLSAPTSKVSQWIDTKFGMTQPVYVLRNEKNNAQNTEANMRTFAFRCVARSINAPAGGYTSSDISLEDWNDYQLSK